MFGKNKFLGIDIGTSAIKIAELRMNNNKPVLSNYAWMKYGQSLADKNLKASSFDPLLLEYLKKIIREAKFESKNAYVSISSSGGLIMLVEFPAMSSSDLEQAIRFEAHKYIPTSLEDIVLSWDVVNNEEVPADGKKMQVLLVAAPKSKVASYEKIISQAGLNLRTIEIESFSIVRSLIGNDPGNFIVVDIGARVCNIILVGKGIIRVNRNIDAGGKDMTRVISTSMGIDEERAEKMKVSGENFLADGKNTKFSALDSIVNEIRRVADAYCRSDKNVKIDEIILSGGTANMAGIEDYIGSQLKIKTMVGNPLGRIEYEKALESKLKETKARFSVAIGLALKGVEEFLVNK